MATRVSIATGNFTTAGTWGTVDATSLLDSEANNTALTTSYVTSSTFTPGAITIDRICVKIASRAASPSGTISIALDQAGGTVAGTEVTINVSDLDQCSASGTSPAVDTNEGGWYAFKFSSVLLLAATAYSVKAKTSSSSQVNLFRNSTSNNWSRMLGTTTTGAPASADILHVIGEHTGAGTGNSFTVTMDNTASTTFGAVANTLGAFTVGKRGTLTWGVSASTAYLLTIAGPVIIFSGGTWNQGTSGARMPATSSGKLLFAITTNVDGGFVARKGSTVNRYGAIVTATSTLLNTDEAAAATVIGVASTSGWSATDDVAFAPTARTSTEYEKKTISTVDSGVQITLTAGLTYAHSGTSPTQAEVIHLTRNVKVCGTSTTLQAFVLYGSTATVNDSYCQFYNLGSATTNKRGIDVLTTTGSYTAIGCTCHDNQVANSRGWCITGATASNISITYSHTYNVIADHFLVTITGTTGTWTIDNCVAIGGSAEAFELADVGGTLTNCTAAGCSVGFSIVEAAIVGTFSGLTSHANTNNGFTITSLFGGTISTLTSWRNGSAGLGITTALSNVIFDTMTLFGNTTQNINLSANVRGCVIRNATISGDSTFSTTNGIAVSGSGDDLLIESSTFGVVAGIKTAHTNDVNHSGTGELKLRNCTLASATEVLITSALPSAMVYSQKHDQTAGLHKRWNRYGIAVIDTVTYKTASPSEQLTPSSATVKFASSPKQCAVANGATVTPTTYVYKSAAYNGAQPRLIVRANAALGITADTVLATASGGTGSWLTLSGTTAAVNDDGVLEFYVDCDGTAGTCNVDDWSVA